MSSRPPSNVAQIIIATCAVITLLIAIVEKDKIINIFSPKKNKKEKVVIKNNVEFFLRECKKNKSNINCEFLIVNDYRYVNLAICASEDKWKSYLIDQNGVEYLYSKIKIEKEESSGCLRKEIYPKGPPLRFIICFTNINPKIDYLEKIVIGTSIGELKFNNISLN